MSWKRVCAGIQVVNGGVVVRVCVPGLCLEGGVVCRGAWVVFGGWSCV